MNTRGIGGQDQWSHFIQLAGEARVRNQGLTGAQKQARVHAASYNSASSFQSLLRSSQAVPNSRTATVNPAAGQQNVQPSKILGGLFDAYA